jgi:hypothetical protein
MRIAQVAPLAESVPPKLYGGTERVVAWLTEELIALGHDVTLFASGDSATSARLVPAWPRALRLGRPKADPAVAETALLPPQLDPSAVADAARRAVPHHAA